MIQDVLLCIHVNNEDKLMFLNSSSFQLLFMIWMNCLVNFSNLHWKVFWYNNTLDELDYSKNCLLKECKEWLLCNIQYITLSQGRMCVAWLELGKLCKDSFISMPAIANVWLWRKMWQLRTEDFSYVTTIWCDMLTHHMLHDISYLFKKIYFIICVGFCV